MNRSSQTAELLPQAVLVAEEDGRTIISLAGEVDVSVASKLAAAIAAAESDGRPVSIDAGDVTFMDSSGIALVARAATRTPATLQVINPPEVVRFLLDVTRVGELVEVVERF